MVFLDACRGQPTPYTPVWLMRQAGRYQPEYRAIREKVGFLELCKNPDLAAEVTVLAAEQLGADAGIIFADILLVLEPLNIGFSFEKGDGPKIHEPIRTPKQVDAVASSVDAEASLGYVLEAIKRTKRSLGVPLIGFAGAPFTLASYAIEGGGSKNYYATKRMMFGDPGLFHALMERLTTAIIDYLNAQIRAGADAVQLFDSWVGCLSERDYRRHVLPHVRRIFESLDRSVPSIHFGTGNPSLYAAMAEAGGDVIGVDWRVDLPSAWDALGVRAMMGNLDPGYLLAEGRAMEDEVTRILEGVGARPGHIFNLGHGIMPEADPARVRALVDHVHEVSAKLKG
jgi:uroporphyrinogen decarboxylase